MRSLRFFIPFLSRHFDLNGIAEARSLELGALFSPNHLLYRPLGLLVQDLLAAVGVPVRSYIRTAGDNGCLGEPRVWRLRTCSSKN